MTRPRTQHEVTQDQVGAFYDDIFNLGTPERSLFYLGEDDSHVLTTSVAPDHVLLTAGMEPDQPFGTDHGFYAYRTWERGRAVLSFMICNDVQGQRHPLIRPAQLFNRAVQYFEETGPLDAIVGDWLMPPDPSMNYEQYTAALREITNGRRPTPEERKIAALRTWTGSCAIDAGFSEVEQVIYKRDRVAPYFVRPEN